MKLIDHFDDFLKDVVNLNQTRIQTLESRVATIETFLRGSDYGASIRRFSKQGSWAHKTIIKPPTDADEFDADLVVYVRRVKGWTARDYIVDLRRVFRESDRYADKVSMKTRCVRIDYAGDFHLDIVPIVAESHEFPSNAETFYVCNRDADEFEQTDGDGFADWWLGRDAVTARHHLIKVTRLLKYLRDFKGTFSVKSVLLTTLIGERVHTLDEILSADEFEDVPTTLKTIIDRMDDWLQLRRLMPEVENPALDGENFTRNWTQDQYENFRSCIHRYREWIDDAYSEKDREESIKKWRRVFGDDFAGDVKLEKATQIVASLAVQLGRHDVDPVALVVAHGADVLQHMPRNFPHVRLPPFRRGSRNVQVLIRASEQRRRGGPNLRSLRSGDIIDPTSGIEFRAVTGTGVPFSSEFEVQWQVVNTGRVAESVGGLRGDFYQSSGHATRYETTSYRGVHWIEAFVLDSRTQTLLGRSDRHFVVIRLPQGSSIAP